MGAMEATPTDIEAATPAAPATHRHRPAWLAPAVVGATALGACVTIAMMNPVEDGDPQVCPFKILTGLDCPGCGATRATNALLRGHPGVAADQNLLFVMLLPVASVAYALWVLRSTGVAAPDAPSTRRWVPVLIGLVAAFWALRLLPWEPFTWLASGRW
jgi:hypothetical protein